ncbi:hypothetical protein MAR_033908 [Mya arenaria]|uniref:Uncharacterized protein n=1 Tax=Mya arenaria TaxID=6604 RepID=A0ABY7GEJ0_MYAAR|nr:hypothetical protein MAR_033908 [Mya arenaria]
MFSGKTHTPEHLRAASSAYSSSGRSTSPNGRFDQTAQPTSLVPQGGFAYQAHENTPEVANGRRTSPKPHRRIHQPSSTATNSATAGSSSSNSPVNSKNGPKYPKITKLVKERRSLDRACAVFA